MATKTETKTEETQEIDDKMILLPRGEVKIDGKNATIEIGDAKSFESGCPVPMKMAKAVFSYFNRYQAAAATAAVNVSEEVFTSNQEVTKLEAITPIRGISPKTKDSVKTTVYRNKHRPERKLGDTVIPESNGAAISQTTRIGAMRHKEHLKSLTALLESKLAK